MTGSAPGRPLTLVGSPPPSARETAVWLLDQGLWPVVVRPGVKAPLGRGWGLARPTPDTLAAAFRRAPGAGVGVLLGPRGGVVDLEVDDPDAAGSALARLVPEGMPPTAGWDSARGRHRLFRWAPALARLPSVVTLAAGALEFRAGGERKQVMSVCPPTRGTDGTRRRWVGESDIRPVPEVLLSHLLSRVVPNCYLPHTPNDPPDGVLEREAARVRAAAVGSRNATLNRAAFVAGLYVGRRRIDRADAASKLVSAAEACGLPTTEAAQTIDRGLDAGTARADASDV